MYIPGLIVRREDYEHLNAMEERWLAQPEDTIGGWCVTIEDIPGSPANGNPMIADFVTEEHAQHIAQLHNNWLETDRD